MGGSPQPARMKRQSSFSRREGPSPPWCPFPSYSYKMVSGWPTQHAISLNLLLATLPGSPRWPLWCLLLWGSRGQVAKRGGGKGDSGLGSSLCKGQGGKNREAAQGSEQRSLQPAAHYHHQGARKVPRLTGDPRLTNRTSAVRTQNPRPQRQPRLRSRGAKGERRGRPGGRQRAGIGCAEGVVGSRMNLPFLKYKKQNRLWRGCCGPQTGDGAVGPNSRHRKDPEHKDIFRDQRESGEGSQGEGWLRSQRDKDTGTGQEDLFTFYVTINIGYLLIYFGCAAWLIESQFPDQWLNSHPRHKNSWSPNHWLCCWAWSLSLAWLFVAVVHQAPLSKGFPRQEYWNGLPFPTPGDLPDPGIELKSLASPALAGRFFTTSATWEAP